MMRNILPIWGQIIQTCKMIWFSWLLSDDGDDIDGNDDDDDVNDQVVEVAKDVDAEEMMMVMISMAGMMMMTRL